MHRIIHRLILAALVWMANPGHAQDFREDPAAPASALNTMPKDPWTLTIAPYVHHWSKSPEHRHAFIVSLEQHQNAHRLYGMALFRNSFGQPSAYAYAAYHQHGVLGNPRLSAKISAGLIYGYKGEYADKVPLNWHGYSPGLIPSLGYKVTEQDSVHIMLLGTAGFTLGYSHSF
ncbi:MAG: ABC transporter ATP-binding protein [Curvibacter sp.]